MGFNGGVMGFYGGLMGINGGLMAFDGNFNGIWLVVAANPSEKYEFVSWDYDIPNIWKNKKCSKPPTSVSVLGMS